MLQNAAIGIAFKRRAAVAGIALYCPCPAVLVEG
jgi:hypothetical protein